MSHLPRKLIIGIVVAVLLTLAGFFLIAHPAANLSPISTLTQKISPSPTPFPFQELTIPYLRSRTYSSQLGERAQYAEHSNYTAYLTSYDSDGLEKWVQFRTTDWMTELDYPEYTAKEIKRFLQC